MELRMDQMDRACGVLLGQACGDALGVPYEFATPAGARRAAADDRWGPGQLRAG